MLRASQVALVVENPPASAGDIRDAGSILGPGRSSGEGNGNPLQDSCLENSMDRGAWWATLHGVAKSQTQLSDWTELNWRFLISLFRLLIYLSSHQKKLEFAFIILSGFPLCMHAKSFQSCPALCNTMDCSPAGSSVHGIFQARILEWVAMPSSRGSSWARDWIRISGFSCLAGGFFTTESSGKP